MEEEGVKKHYELGHWRHLQVRQVEEASFQEVEHEDDAWGVVEVENDNDILAESGSGCILLDYDEMVDVRLEVVHAAHQLSLVELYPHRVFVVVPVHLVEEHELDKLNSLEEEEEEVVVYEKNSLLDCLHWMGYHPDIEHKADEEL